MKITFEFNEHEFLAGFRLLGWKATCSPGRKPAGRLDTVAAATRWFGLLVLLGSLAVIGSALGSPWTWIMPLAIGAMILVTHFLMPGRRKARRREWVENFRDKATTVTLEPDGGVYETERHRYHFPWKGATLRESRTLVEIIAGHMRLRLPARVVSPEAREQIRQWVVAGGKVNPS
jgi:hypothetical protein